MLNILILTYHILHVCKFITLGYIVICFMMDILFMAIILHLMQIHLAPSTQTFHILSMWVAYAHQTKIYHTP